MTVEMLLGLIERIEARLRRAPYEVKSTPFLLQFRHWSGGRGERAKERWLKRADCLQRKEVSPAQTTDSEGTRKRFFYRGRPWEGRNGYGRCLAQRSSADKSGMHLCLDAANQVHGTEREHDRVGEPDRDAAFAFWSIFSGEPFR